MDSGHDDFFDIEVTQSELNYMKNADPEQNRTPADDDLAEQLKLISARLKAGVDTATTTDRSNDGEDEGAKSPRTPITPMAPLVLSELISLLPQVRIFGISPVRPE
jgi:hypothetical protein